MRMNVYSEELTELTELVIKDPQDDGIVEREIVKIDARFPASVHARLADLAHERGVSISKIVNEAIGAFLLLDGGTEQLLIDAAQLLGIATVGSGADPVEFDRRASEWLRRFDEKLGTEGPTASQVKDAIAWGRDV